jgi:hypothetical protein
MLHLTNGDGAATPLRRSGLAGDVIVWADVLHEGPAPPEHGEAWRRVRSEFLCRLGYGEVGEVLAQYARSEAALDRYHEHDELVLWFEHDLFDQLLLARHLHWLGTQGHTRTRLSLVCIDRFPGAPRGDRFNGLGNLLPEDFLALFPQRQPITDEHLGAGADVWRAFTDADPRALNALTVHGVASLPFMAGAIARHLEEFPGVADGLSRTERNILETVAGQPLSPHDLFLALQHREERVFMGDSTFWQIVREMAGGRQPLVHVSVSVDRADALPDGLVSVAPAGANVLNGADALALRGIDRWRGGVHLTPENLWRWDSASKEVKHDKKHENER